MKAFFIRVPKNRPLPKRLRRTGIADILRVNWASMNFNYYAVRPALDSIPKGQSTSDFSHLTNCEEQSLPMTESPTSPYFDHVRSALHVIDD